MAGHARDCEACAEIVRISGWMQRFAAVLEVPKLPSAREIWSRAEFLAKQSPVARSLRAINLVSWTVLAVVPAALIFFCWPFVKTWIRGVEQGNAAYPVALSTPWSLVWMAASIVGVATLLTAQMIFAEE
jgi:hypothetical protein